MIPNEPTGERLALFQTDAGITMAFGERTYHIDADDPFHNIAIKAMEQEDYVPFYVEMARQEGLGEQFRDALLEEIRRLEQESHSF